MSPCGMGSANEVNRLSTGRKIWDTETEQTDTSPDDSAFPKVVPSVAVCFAL